ncbi:T-cell surface protein tactile isoform X1 [Labrus bergylta]|uniref:T-cell surface protein tactile isoform X1 n=1 Tax=Labrus bergylta TaxID=56723 RepID=UPI003313F124
MSLGSSDMAGSALGLASSLLLLASMIQGLQDVEVFHHEEMEALVGQNVTLPCTVRNTDLKIISIEWKKRQNKDIKLALYSRDYGVNYFWSNVSIHTQKESMGSLQLSTVSKWDSGIYICDLTMFPHGTIRKETKLEIKDDAIQCDVDSTVEVHTGGNVSINCTAPSDAQYTWTKVMEIRTFMQSKQNLFQSLIVELICYLCGENNANHPYNMYVICMLHNPVLPQNKTVVSVNEFLQLWQVTEAHTGVYTLTVNTGNQTMQKEFIITVLTETTSSSTDLVTLSPQSNGTETGLIQTKDSNLTTSATTGLPTVNNTLPWTMRDLTFNNSHPTNVSTPFINDTHVSVTSTPDPHHFSNSSYQELNQTDSLNASTSVARDLSTTVSYGSTLFGSTQENRNESMWGTGHPDGTSTMSTGNKTMVTENEGAKVVRSHLLLVLIIILLLVVIAATGFLYRRHIIKKRLDLPPPFKPPPPPVKYTAARQRDIYTQPYPTSRCDSVTNMKV